MKPEFILDCDGKAIDIKIESISDICSGTLDKCEKECPKQCSCQLVAIANDLLKIYNKEI